MKSGNHGIANPLGLAAGRAAGLQTAIGCPPATPTHPRALPADRFPALAAYGTHAWADDRDQRFNSGLDTLFRGLQAEIGPAQVPSGDLTDGAGER